MPDLDRYAWTREIDAVCVAVVRGRTEDEVIDGYGGDPAGAAPVAPDGSWDGAGAGGPVLFVRSVAGAVLVVEDNGFQGTRPEVLREVTAGGGVLVSAYWNVNALSQFTLAEGGEVAVAFEALSPGERFGTDPDRLLPWMRQAGYRDDGDEPGGSGEDWRAQLLVLLEAVTGVAATGAELAGPFRAVTPAPVPGDLMSRDALAHSFLRSQDPEVSAALDAAPDERLRRAAVAAARATAAFAGVDREPLLRAALEAAERGAVGPVDRRSPLGRLLAGWALADGRAEAPAVAGTGSQDEADRLWWRVLAGTTVRAALDPDPLVAAHEAASYARVYQPKGAPARAALLAALRGN